MCLSSSSVNDSFYCFSLYLLINTSSLNPFLFLSCPQKEGSEGKQFRNNKGLDVLALD